MFGLAVLFGVMVGFALGLTGSGGGIFAVPLLVYGLHVAPREAVGISLAAVGGTAMCGVLPRWRLGQVELKTGALFALGGALGAPVGTKLSRLLSEQSLLLLFSGLMMLIAIRMWQTSKPKPAEHLANPSAAHPLARVCQRCTDGKLLLTPTCGILLGSLGFATGILASMFGVGGGFVIVPALVLLSGMEIHDAVGTSLLVIVLVSTSSVVSYLLAGGQLSTQTTGLFILGGFVGMQGGTRLSQKLSGTMLQRVFSVAILLVAAFVIFKSTMIIL